MTSTPTIRQEPAPSAHGAAQAAPSEAHVSSGTTRAAHQPHPTHGSHGSDLDATADPRAIHGGKTDMELIKAFRGGDPTAFEELVLRHQQLIYNFIYRMVGEPQSAEDLFQDTWLKVLRNAHTYKPKAKFTTWAIQIARNTVLDFFKRNNLRQHVSLDLAVLNDELSLKSLVPSVGPQPEEVLLAKEMTDEVQRAICRLPIKQQESLVLRIYHKLPYNEIAVLVEAPEGTVKYWVHEAVKALTQYLEKRGIV